MLSLKPSLITPLLVASCATLSLEAKVSLAPLFTDGAVLQRESPVAIWGRGEAGELVQVQFGGAKAAGAVDASGRWLLVLPPMPASAQARDLTVEGEIAGAKTSITLHNILVGDVWLCTGQSNIEWPVRLSDGGAEAAAKDDLPTIRHLKIPRASASAMREDFQAEWKIANPENTPHFSGVGYFFARHLQSRLQVPIGLINCTFGGTAIECWFDPTTLKATPAGAACLRNWEQKLDEFAKARAEYEQRLGAAVPGQASLSKPPAPSEWGAPCGVYYGMLYSIQPYTIRGVIWYQGESNVGRPDEYRVLFPELIQSWRQMWARPELPFLFAQLPNFHDANDKSDMAWASLRDAQTSALKLPATGMAVTIDVGEAENLHPTNKRPVGERMAAAAEHIAYGLPGEWSGPTIERVVRDGDKLLVTFDHANGGVVLKDFMVSGFELADADGVYYPAAAEAQGNVIRLRAGHVEKPAHVRYAWRNAPVPTVFNREGFPAAPFQRVIE